MNFKNSVLLLGVLLVIGCMPRGNLPVMELYPVQWFSGFTMEQWLVKKAPMHDQEDIRALLDKPWEYPVKLIHLRTQEVFSADRCSQILPNIRQLETYQPSEFPPFTKLSTMCVASESIANALPARDSFLSDFKLDADFPLHAPKNLAFVPSSAEWKRISQNKKVVSWADVETVKFVSKEGEYQAKYAMVGAFQEFSLIARGDFNRDSIEDILLHVQGNVVGGSYVSYQLFWITKIDANSPLTLIREYPEFD